MVTNIIPSKYIQWRKEGRSYQNIVLPNGYSCQRSQLFIAIQYVLNIFKHTHFDVTKPIMLRNSRILASMGMTQRMYDTLEKTLTKCDIVTRVESCVYKNGKFISSRYIVNTQNLQGVSKFLFESGVINETWIPIRFRHTMFSNIPHNVDYIYVLRGNIKVRRPIKQLKKPVKKEFGLWKEICPGILYRTNIEGQTFLNGNIDKQDLFHITYKCNVENNPTNLDIIPTNKIEIELFTYEDIKNFCNNINHSFNTQPSLTNDNKNIPYKYTKNMLRILNVQSFLEYTKGLNLDKCVVDRCESVLSPDDIPVPITFSSKFSVHDILFAYARSVCRNKFIEYSNAFVQYLNVNGNSVTYLPNIKIKRCGRNYVVYVTARQHCEECDISSDVRSKKLLRCGNYVSFDIHSAAATFLRWYNTGEFDIGYDVKTELLSSCCEVITKDSVKELQMRFLFGGSLRKSWSDYIRNKGINHSISRNSFNSMYNKFYNIVGCERNKYGPCLFILETFVELFIYVNLVKNKIQTVNVYDCFYCFGVTAYDITAIINETMKNLCNKSLY